MLKLGIYGLALTLFILLYLCFYLGITLSWDRQSRKSRLQTYRQTVWSKFFADKMLQQTRLYQHLQDLLLALRWSLSPDSFAGLSLLMAMFGAASGVLVFQTIRSVLVLFVVLGCLPYLILRISLINRQMATRLEFLPAVELFYQCYLVTGCRHVRLALQKAVEERRLPGEVQAVFEQLYRNLSVKGDDAGSLRRFTMSFGHTWADFFVSIMKVSLEEGNNVSDNLKELVSDMRKSQMANQRERHRLLEIRLANFAPIVFLALFMGINFRLNPEGSYQYYLVDAGGRGMLLNAIVMLFGSFIMGLYLSRRKL